MPFTAQERADLLRRLADDVQRTGDHRSIADLIREALWPDGPPTS
jgi:hypothetical protein